MTSEKDFEILSEDVNQFSYINKCITDIKKQLKPLQDKLKELKQKKKRFRKRYM